MTLTEFLLARIAEDEEIAKAGLGEPQYPHYGDTAAEESWRMAKAEGCSRDGYRFHRLYGPGRVLAECEAKRRIVDELRPFVPPLGASRNQERLLRLLALPYADHPDYREEWRPN